MNQFVVFASEAGHGGNSFLLGHNLAEVFWTALASVIVFAFLWWKAGPAIGSSLKARTDRIAQDLADAEQARTGAEARLAEVQARVAGAGDERQRILVEARQTAEALKEQILARAAEEAESTKTRAATDIESAKRQAIADLQAEVADLALGAAEAIVSRNLDADTQHELIDGYIEQLGAAT